MTRGRETGDKTMETKITAFSVCYQMPTHQAETIVRAVSKDDAIAKVLAWQPQATKIRWAIEVAGQRGWN